MQNQRKLFSAAKIKIWFPVVKYRMKKHTNHKVWKYLAVNIQHYILAVLISNMASLNLKTSNQLKIVIYKRAPPNQLPSNGKKQFSDKRAITDSRSK